jgi:hypothetical protein
MNNISDLAQHKLDGEKAREVERQEKNALRVRQTVPAIALLVANIIFISMDVRAFDVTRRLTNGSILLACTTVLVSGVLALLWWDILYPHSRRHSNQVQIKLSIAGSILGIVLSAILAFLDYIVGNVQLSVSFLWGVVICITAVQGVLFALWWLVDNSIEAEAKRQKTHSNRMDLHETVEDFGIEIKSLKSISAQLEELRKDFPGKGQAAKAALALGYPVLASMLGDDDNNGILNYQEKNWQPPLRMGQAFSSETRAPEEDEDRSPLSDLNRQK